MDSTDSGTDDKNISKYNAKVLPARATFGPLTVSISYRAGAWYYRIVPDF